MSLLTTLLLLGGAGGAVYALTRKKRIDEKEEDLKKKEAEIEREGAEVEQERQSMYAQQQAAAYQSQAPMYGGGGGGGGGDTALPQTPYGQQPPYTPPDQTLPAYDTPPITPDPYYPPQPPITPDPFFPGDGGRVIDGAKDDAIKTFPGAVKMISPATKIMSAGLTPLFAKGGGDDGDGGEDVALQRRASGTGARKATSAVSRAGSLIRTAFSPTSSAPPKTPLSTPSRPLQKRPTITQVRQAFKPLRTRTISRPGARR